MEDSSEEERDESNRRRGRVRSYSTERQVATTTAFPAPALCKATAAAIATISQEAPATGPIAEMFPASWLSSTTNSIARATAARSSPAWSLAQRVRMPVATP
jgi:hypothetical protein